jgi:hypothetical protein
VSIFREPDGRDEPTLSPVHEEVDSTQHMTRGWADPSARSGLLDP